MATSKLQRYCGTMLQTAFSRYHIEENYRPRWLVSPDTGHPLELDFYIADLRAAIEVQGVQHIKHVPHFHRDIYAFQRRKRYDQSKAVQCKDNQIALYLVYTEQDVHDVVWRLRNREAAIQAESRDVSNEALEKSLKSIAENLAKLIQSRPVMDKGLYKTKTLNAQRKIAAMLHSHMASGSPPVSDKIVAPLLYSLSLAMREFSTRNEYEVGLLIKTYGNRTVSNREEETTLKRLRAHASKVMWQLLLLLTDGSTDKDALKDASATVERLWRDLDGKLAKESSPQQLRIRISWLCEWRDAIRRSNSERAS